MPKAISPTIWVIEARIRTNPEEWQPTRNVAFDAFNAHHDLQNIKMKTKDTRYRIRTYTRKDRRRG